MARVTKVIDVCDRCVPGREKVATVTKELSPDGSFYELKLCETHGDMYDRDMSGWTRLAKEIDPPRAGRSHSEFFTAERRAETQRIKELREKANDAQASKAFAARRAAEIEKDLAAQEEVRARQSIPGAMNWKLTDHARERMVERGFTIFEVLQAAALPDTTYNQIWGGEHDKEIYQRNDCRVAVNPALKVIITVIDRSTQLQTTQPANGTEQKVTVAR